MSESTTLNQLSSASSLDGLSLIATAATGNGKQVNPKNIPKIAYVVSTAYIMDFNEATEPGIWLLDGQHTPLNGPTGMSFVAGLLEVFHRYNSNTVFQRAMGIHGEMATRCLFQSNWSAWKVVP